MSGGRDRKPNGVRLDRVRSSCSTLSELVDGAEAHFLLRCARYPENHPNVVAARDGPRDTAPLARSGLLASKKLSCSRNGPRRCRDSSSENSNPVAFEAIMPSAASPMLLYSYTSWGEWPRVP